MNYYLIIIEGAEDYLRELEYMVWIPIRDIPRNIAQDVLLLIDEGFLCRYLFNDDFTSFRKYRFE